MNKAITDGLVFMPPAFSGGLDVWSSQNGTPGSDTYDGSGNGAFVPADANFAGCLEVVKTQSVTKVRYMGETPILPGCYLRVTARVKAVAGAFPAVRIAGWAGQSGGGHATVDSETGPSTQLTTYGEVVEISAIIGTGDRTGVDMIWNGAIYGHIGLDLTGSNGGVIRIDDIQIEDVTNVFIRDMMGVVDVRDYGAIGDGVTNDSAAFEAADAAAGGRKVLISEGVYHLANNVTFQNEVKFEGTITMPADRYLILQRNFDYQTYLDAFANEELALKKSFQALLNYSDHESLDLGGRRIGLTEPLDLQAAEGTKTSFASRRVIRNGQLAPISGPAWDPDVFASQGTYSTSTPLTLTNVTGVANIPVGSLITGNGVGREIYVRAKNEAAQTITLSQPLFDAEGTQVFTFTRFKYLLDFSGFTKISLFILSDIEFQCNNMASGVILANSGTAFHVRDCFFTKPSDRAITSHGSGCQGLMIDRCNIQSSESTVRVQDRTTIAINTNANDLKVRDNRGTYFRHFVVVGGSGSTIVGNHWFQGDEETDGVRLGGLVFATSNVKSIVTGNYIDNNFIEWTNEYDATPDQGSDFSFGGLTITGNTFTANDVARWFNWIVVKPHGSDHFINGLSVTGNVFRTLNGNIDRIEHVDTTFADLKYNSMRNITFTGNVFNAINEPIENPRIITATESTASQTWIIDTDTKLPFRGFARTVESYSANGQLRNSGSTTIYDAPWFDTEYGADKREVRVVWREPTRGSIRCRLRMDNPL
ncbi:right-handed parallel beta-helix repeat-containing protein [Aestuariibius sp. HNIBRBA575]|uniref:right-handed parallel beta-helix repeat-containing protein n=1 Tax=Aestuariibius sp. HNIBRBA575 TaxID=3233343 RepID=UPI0034A32B83